MENERSLTERFAAIESKLADSKVLLELGKANELPFFIFDYDPKQELIVRDEVKKLKKNNPNIQEFDLFEMVVEFLKKEGYLDTVKEYETQYDSNILLSQLFQPFLSLEEDNNPVMQYFIDNVKDDGNHIVLITGVGKVYPIIRSHTILNKLQPVIKKNPVVMIETKGIKITTSLEQALKILERIYD